MSEPPTIEPRLKKAEASAGTAKTLTEFNMPMAWAARAIEQQKRNHDAR